MASWFATSAEEIRRQLEQLAGESGGKFTSEDVGLGALFEHGQAVLRASADRAAEQVQQSVQRLATEADEGLQTVGATFAASVSAWSGPRAAEDLHSSDLINLYRSEVETFSSSYVQGDASDETSKASAIAAQTLSLWNQRLQGDTDSEGQCLAAPGLRGLLATEGLQTVLRALTRGGGRRRRPLLGRAAAVAAECAAGAAPGSPSGRLSRKASDEGKALDAKLSEAQTEAAVGEQLARLVLRVAEAPEALVAQLLALLAEAAEAADRCEGGELAEEKNPAEEDVCWVVNLLLATLTERKEADALASQRLKAALKEALEGFSKAESEGKRLQHPTAACKAAPFAGGGRPDIGGNVWACYPLDGHWYRAQVRGFAPRDRVRVAWCSRPEHDGSQEYVHMRESDGDLFSELSSYSVMRVDASIRRPPPSPLDQVLSEALWCQSLQIVEDNSQLFRRLRHVGKQLDVHLEWSTAASGGATTAAEGETVWRYVPEDGNHIDIRAVPSISGNRTHERLVAGEVFRVSETFEGSDGTLYLKLADGRGWVFDSKAGIGTLCVRCQSDSEDDSQSDEPGPSEQPLSGTAETLSAWRVEIEERAEYLGSFASECEEEVQTFEGQIASSTEAMRAELE
ncbi:gapN, partial [Symbiodinium natans]